MKSGACPGMKGLNLSKPADPGPGVAEVERFHAQVEAGRRANRPPDAALSPADVQMLAERQQAGSNYVASKVSEIEGQARKGANWISALTAERDWYKSELDRECERTGVREVVLIAALRRAKWLYHIYGVLAMALLAPHVWGFAKSIWRLL